VNTPYVGDPERFRFIDPPFQLNAADIAQYPAEVTGYHLLQSMQRRLGWDSLAGKRLLDFGCGVRFTRTIYNLDLNIGEYVGVDVKADVIAWLQTNVDDSRFRFAHLDMQNAMYHPAGGEASPSVLLAFGSDFDAACMFSVITHQTPDDAKVIYELLHAAVRPGGQLYFTAFTDQTVERYAEREPLHPCELSTYNADFLCELANEGGWSVEAIYPKSEPTVQQTAFVCRNR
jgi:SAM-dependent methyltransferase